MFEITITEICYRAADLMVEKPERIERFKQVVDTVDIPAVFKAVNGVRRKRKGKEKAA